MGREHPGVCPRLGDYHPRQARQRDAVLPQSDFDPDAYHLYEVVYDPLVTDEAGCTSRGFAANCAATLYVDGTDQGVYYPYRFPGNVTRLRLCSGALAARAGRPTSATICYTSSCSTTAAAKTTSNSLWATARVAPGMCLGALLRQCRAVLFRLFCCSSVQS